MEAAEQIRKAATHAVKWCEVEEEAYAGKAPGKFGYNRNLQHLRNGQFRPESVWSGQLGNYWFRGVLMYQSARQAGVDSAAARQQFAKQTNAARALLTTLVATAGDGNYQTAKRAEAQTLQQYADTLSSVLFSEANLFDHGDFWTKQLLPARVSIAAALNDDTVSEVEAFSAAIRPTRNFMLRSFEVLLAHIVNEGPLPEPGHPSGTIIPWQAPN